MSDSNWLTLWFVVCLLGLTFIVYKAAYFTGYMDAMGAR